MLSTPMLTFRQHLITIHFVNEFQKKLQTVLATPPFEGNQRALAQYTGVDRGLLNRVLKGTRSPTPELVGRLCGTLPPNDAAQLLESFLGDVVGETASAKPKPSMSGGHRGPWRRPLSDLSVQLRCAPKTDGR